MSRGTYQTRPFGNRVVIGNPLYHSLGDIEDAVKQMAFDYEQTYQDLGHKIGILGTGPNPLSGDPERIKAHPLWFTWWKASAEPLFDSFNKFKLEMLGGGLTFACKWIARGARFEVTSWDNEILSWHKKLVEMRAQAKTLGIDLDTPAPAKLSTTIVEDVKNLATNLANKVEGAGGDVWQLAKIGIYGALAIGGILVLSSVVQDLRANQAPVDRYQRFAQSGMRSAARVA
jgi:hypothetical protein